MKKFLVEVEVTRKQKAVVVVEANQESMMPRQQVFVDAIEQSKSLDAGAFVDKEVETIGKSAKALPDNLNSDQLYLISAGYPLDMVLQLNKEDAEAEVEAIPYSF